MGKPKPTEMQVKYFAAKISGSPTKKEAALKAGYSQKIAENATQKVEGTVGYKTLKELLDTAEMKEQMQKVLSEGLKATKPVVVDGEIHDYTDFAVRRQYVDTVTDITGDKAKKEIDVTSDGEKLEIQFTNILDPKDE